ncbi:hypothetical protein ABZ694_06805 [Streptomyces albidoflavus]|uniref:hypothetical protein n=1 Tax=Streptomyces albidoflavus TaxID=1886 RepID=UPI0033FF1680
MGTSTRWKGPRWPGLNQRFSRWTPERSDPGRAAASAVDALHRACRADPDAFGLREASTAAGLRLADTMRVLAKEGPTGLRRAAEHQEGEQALGGSAVPHGETGATGLEWSGPADAFVADLTERIAGDGTTVVDACLRRAAVVSAGRLLDRAEVRQAVDASYGSGSTVPEGDGWASDLLCLLYRWFFAGLVSEFLRAVVAEQIDLTLPGLSTAMPEAGIPEKVTDLVLSLVPDPCEEATEREGPSGLVPGGELYPEVVAAAADDPAAATPDLVEVARLLVPRSVGAVLGLADGMPGIDEAATTTPSDRPADEEPSA